jgi:transposase
MINWYVGVDWGDETHFVVLQDREGREVGHCSVEHSGPGLAELTSWIEGMCKGSVDGIAVAIEVPHGPVVAALLAHGFQVFAANPKQVDRFRDRFSPAGAKDDRLDAFVLGTALRTDPQAFRRLQAQDPQRVRLRGLLGMVEELKQELRRLANRLRAELHDYFPQPLRLAPAADEAWLWDLLELAPLPEQAARLHRRRVQQLLVKRRIRRFTADQLLAELVTMPLPVMPGTSEAASQHVLLLIPRLRLVEEQLRRCQKDLEQLVNHICSQTGQQSEHRDAHILRSMPGAGSLVVATMLAEAAEPLSRRDYHALRAQPSLPI